jgi:cysteinyl-tRNA synthetase
VHGGGMDLIFPHHENEIAQSEAAWGPPFARTWLHSGFVKVDAEKMSKSLGNFVTIAQVLERNDGEALRYFLVGAHYRGPIEFDMEKRPDGRVVFPGIDEAERRVEYLYTTRESLAAAAGGEAPGAEGDSPQAKTVRGAVGRVLSALDNDLNTSVALGVIADLAHAGNEAVLQVQRLKKDPKAGAVARSLAAAALEALDACCRPLGLLQTPYAAFHARSQARRLKLRGLDAAAIEAKVQERVAARARKDFARSDAIRAELTALGIEVQDDPVTGKTAWKALA